MKYQGEIIDINENSAHVRIYKKEEPVNLVLNVTMSGKFSVSDMVNIEMNTFLYFASSAFSYVLPFLASLLSYVATKFFTDNLVIIEIVMLAVLALTYFGIKFFEKSEFFKKLSFGTIMNKVEE